MRAVSPKRAKQLRVYSQVRRDFLEAHQRCEYPRGCYEPATEIQHRRGRRGARLLDTNWWAASCHFHNMLAEEDTGDALDCGWLVRVEGVA